MQPVSIIRKLASILLNFRPAFCRTRILVMFLLPVLPSCLLNIPNPTPLHNTIYIEDPSACIFNLNIRNDTVFMDSEDMIDFWMEMEGQAVDSVFIFINGERNFIYNPDEIHSLDLFGKVKGRNTIQFEFNVAGPLESTHYKTQEMVLLYEENMPSRFVRTEMIEGRLGLLWPGINSDKVEGFEIERSIDDQVLSTSTSDHPLYIDDNYVGEKARYRIRVKLKDGRLLRSYNYEKAKEDLKFELSQNGNNGYIVKFEKSRYAYAFQSYYVVHSINNENKHFLYRSENINDTTIVMGDAKFMNTANILVYIPPGDVLDYMPEDGSVAFRHGHSGHFGLPGIQYSDIVQTDQDQLYYLKSGDIYAYSLTDKTSQVIPNHTSEKFQCLGATSGRDVIYASGTNSEYYHVDTYFWSTESGNDLLQQRTFRYYPQYVSDNLFTVQVEESRYSSSDTEVYDIAKGIVTMTIPYSLTSVPSAISPGGQYLLLNRSKSRLLKLAQDHYSVLLDEDDGLGYYGFVEFDPLVPSDIYMVELLGGFVKLNVITRKATSLYPMHSIISIDFFARKIFGEGENGIGVYDLDSGILLQRVNINEFYAASCILIGDRIFNGQGYIYELN